MSARSSASGSASRCSAPSASMNDAHRSPTLRSSLPAGASPAAASSARARTSSSAWSRSAWKAPWAARSAGISVSASQRLFTWRNRSSWGRMSGDSSSTAIPLRRVSAIRPAYGPDQGAPGLQQAPSTSGRRPPWCRTASRRRGVGVEPHQQLDAEEQRGHRGGEVGGRAAGRRRACRRAAGRWSRPPARSTARRRPGCPGPARPPRRRPASIWVSAATVPAWNSSSCSRRATATSPASEVDVAQRLGVERRAALALAAGHGHQQGVHRAEVVEDQRLVEAAVAGDGAGADPGDALVPQGGQGGLQDAGPGGAGGRGRGAAGMPASPRGGEGHLEVPGVHQRVRAPRWRRCGGRRPGRRPPRSG